MLERTYTSFFIDGAWQPARSTERHEVISPSTGKAIGSVPSAGNADIDAAVEAARRAFYETDWATRPCPGALRRHPPPCLDAGGPDRRHHQRTDLHH